MANNRDEFKAEVDNLLVAKVTIAGNHKPMIKDKLADSIHFKKDVIGATQVVIASGVVTVDFSDKDLAVLNAVTNNCSPNITISNLENGDASCYIKITKNAAKTITWANATDLSLNKVLITAGTAIVYHVFQKQGVIYVNGLNTDISSNVRTRYRLEIGVWDMDSTVTANVVHGMADYTKIENVSVHIIPDAGTSRTMLAGEGLVTVFSSSIGLQRTTGGVFDSTSYNDAVMNRGYIYFDYRE